MSRKERNLLKVAILTMSLVQLGTNGIGPILAQISETFPEASDTTIQFLMTFPILFTMIFEILSALVAEKLPKKVLTISGLAVVGLGGVLAFCFHSSLMILFLWAAVIGIGLGMVAPVAPALINESFIGPEKQTMLGWQNSASTIGSMIMTFACGFLAAFGWHFGYLIYLIGIPGIILAFVGLKSETHGKHHDQETMQREAADGSKENRGKFRLVIWREMVIAALFLMLYSAIPANLAMLVVEKGVGDASAAGILTTLFSLAGMLIGMLFGLIMKALKKWTNTLGVIMLVIGVLILGWSNSFPLMIIGCMIAGTSMSMVMPVCMGAASKLAGYEILNSALIMGSTSVGIFITPLLTSLTAAVTGSNAVSYRFITLAIFGVILAGVTIGLREKEQE